MMDTDRAHQGALQGISTGLDETGRSSAVVPPLLEVRNLSVTFPPAPGGCRPPIPVVRALSFAMGREKLALVGESGSGKSMTARALLRLVPPPGRMQAERLTLAGTDLLALDERGMRAIRGRRMAMILQDPRHALNPVMTVGRQVAEAYRLHAALSWREAAVRAVAALEAVRITDPERVARLYPHQVSGGMGQRIMIAMMLAGEPELLIADEPTSALDANLRLEILALIDDLVRSRGLGLLLISHDLDLVARFCDRVLVLYAGREVETCRATELEAARHPYTRGLLACRPRLDRPTATLPVFRGYPEITES